MYDGLVYNKCGQMNGEIYVGKGAGKIIEKSILNAAKSIKIVSPYVSDKYICQLAEKQKNGIEVSLITSNEFNNLKNVFNLLYQQHRMVNTKSLKRLKIKRVLIFISIVFFIVSIVSFSYILLYTHTEYITYFNKMIGKIHINNNAVCISVGTFVFTFLTSVINLIIILFYSNRIKHDPVYKYSYTRTFAFQKLCSCNNIFLHSKIYIIDDKIAYIGSLNFTYNGFHNNIETCVTITSEQTVLRLSEYVQSIIYDTQVFPYEDMRIIKRFFYEPQP